MLTRLMILLWAAIAFASGDALAEGTVASAVTLTRQPVFVGDGASPAAVSDDQIKAGERLFRMRCGGCHSLDSNRVGPRHRGVYGRKAGSVPDFHYSRALRDLDLVWTDETLDAWLEDPTAVAKGTAMGYRLRNAEERAAIIRYLKSLSPSSAVN